MPPKRRRPRPVTPAWVDELIALLEAIGIVVTLLAGLYALAAWVLGWGIHMRSGRL